MGCLGAGNSSSSSNNYTTQYLTDPDSARRMASIAEEQQFIYNTIFKPYDKAMVDANMATIPYNRDLTISQLAAEQGLVDTRAAATKAGLEETMWDINASRPVKEALINQQLTELEQSAPVSGAFYNAAMEGVNAKDWMSSATADAAYGSRVAGKELEQNLQMLGIQKGSDRYNRATQGLSLNRAKAIGTARNTARRAADTENFTRLGQAMQVRGRATGLPGTESTASSATGSMPYQTGALQLGSYGLTNPINTAVQANQAGMNPLTTSLGDSKSRSFNVSLSSERYKEDIVPLVVEDGVVQSLRPVSFKYIGESKPQVGLIAEEVAMVLPEVVEFKDGVPEGIHYQFLVPVLINEIQRLGEKIQALEGRM